MMMGKMTEQTTPPDSDPVFISDAGMKIESAQLPATGLETQSAENDAPQSPVEAEVDGLMKPDVSPPADTKKPRLMHRIPRQLLAVLLLQLTGFGLGLFYIRRWLAGVVNFLATLIFVIIASMMNASHNPVLWLGIFGGWLLVGTVAGGWAAFRTQRTVPVGAIYGAWRPALMALILLGVELGGIVGFTALGKNEFTAGMAAYQSADCRSALQRFHTLSTFFELTFDPNITTADDKAHECSLLVYGETLLDQGEYDKAITAYNTYLSQYPQGQLASVTLESISQAYSDWANALYDSGDYPGALEKCYAIITGYPETPAGKQISLLTAEAYVAWASQLSAQGDYPTAYQQYRIVLDQFPTSPARDTADAQTAILLDEWAVKLVNQGDYADAINKYLTIMSFYPNTPFDLSAAQAASETYAQWADELSEAEDYDQAIAQYLGVMGCCSETPVGLQAPEMIATIYSAWANDLSQQGNYAAAVEKYQILRGYYPDTLVAAQIDDQLAAAYIGWAADLQRQGDFASAIGKYQVVLDYYAATSAAEQSVVSMAQAYLGWANQLFSKGQYQEAISKYLIILDEYPQSLAAVEAADALPGVYVALGSSLQQTSSYMEAIEKYTIALNYFTNSAAFTATQTAIGSAYTDWGIQLTEQDKFTAAIRKFYAAQEVTTDPSIIEIAQQGYDDALWGLAVDTNGEGKQLLEAALVNACAGLPAISPAVGLGAEWSAKALVCSDSDLTLPNDLMATNPASFAYAVGKEIGANPFGMCLYFDSKNKPYWLILQQLWVRAIVYSSQTGELVFQKTLTGSEPPGCPRLAKFSSDTEYLTGSEPSNDDIITWLREIIQ